MTKKKILLKINTNRTASQLHSFIKLLKENNLIPTFIHFKTTPSNYLTQYLALFIKRKLR